MATLSPESIGSRLNFGLRLDPNAEPNLGFPRERTKVFRNYLPELGLGMAAAAVTVTLIAVAISSRRRDQAQVTSKR